MRIIRDSPPELARLFPAPYASKSMTLAPPRLSWKAVHAPKTPAPTTATSNGLSVADGIVLTVDMHFGLRSFFRKRRGATFPGPRRDPGLSVDDHFETAVRHSLHVEGHGTFFHHRRQARVLHHLCVHGV